MNTMTKRTLRMTPLALLLAASLVGCAKRDSDATTAANTPADTTAPAAAPNGTATPSDNSAMATTAGADTGTPMDNTTTGAATGDMSSANATTPATTSADASAMSGMATGPITDTTFYQEALTGGEREIAASKLAEKSSNAEVKALAKTVLADHEALGAKVKAAAGANAPTPATPDTSALSGKTGAELDRAYVDMMVSDHQKDIPMFENASKNASTDKAKQLATAALPKLRKHLDMAQKAQAALTK